MSARYFRDASRAHLFRWGFTGSREQVGMPKPRTTAGLAASVMSQAMTRDHRLFEPMSASR